MSSWTKETAVSELEFLISQIPTLQGERRNSAPHVRWLARALRLLEEVFGQLSRYYGTLNQLTWARTGTYIARTSDPEAALQQIHQDAYVEQLDAARGLLQAALDELGTSDLATVYKGKDTPPESSALIRVLAIVERRLRKGIRDRPENERQVQDALETLLIGADIPYSRESERIEYSSKTYSPDFTFRRLDLALEVKFCNRPDREKDIIAEVNDDILAYRTVYGNLLFVIYDIGFIRDIDRFSGQFEEHEGVIVRVVKH